MQHSVILQKAAMLHNVPPDLVTTTYHPSIRGLSSRKAKKIESKIYQSVKSFLVKCMFKESDELMEQLYQLEEKYSIGT